MLFRSERCAHKQTETDKDRQGQKKTKTDKDRQRRTKTDKDRQTDNLASYNFININILINIYMFMNKRDGLNLV